MRKMLTQLLFVVYILLLVPRFAFAYDILEPGVSMVISGMLSVVGATVAAGIVWKKPNPNDKISIQIIFTITAFIVTLILMFSTILGFLSKLD